MRWTECCACVMAFSAAHQRHDSAATLTGRQQSDFRIVVILDDFGRRKITRAYTR